MDDRKALERKWRKEFDELGEEGVREKLFRGTFLANQRKEAFAYRWLGEKGLKLNHIGVEMSETKPILIVDDEVDDLKRFEKNLRGKK